MRSHSAWGIVFCLALLATGASLYPPYSLNNSPLSFVASGILILLIVLYLLGFFQNPRRLGCRLYALLLTTLSAFGLAASLRHVVTQSQLDADLAPCKLPSWGGAGEHSLPDYIMQLINGVRSCKDTVTIGDSPYALVLTLIFLFFTLYNLYLLFKRIDRPIFR